MKYLFFIVLFYFNISILSAQKVVYTYDQAGNRINREIVLGKLRSAPQAAAEEKTLAHEEMLAEVKIKIYPNPTKGNLSVEIVMQEEKDLQGEIKITDMEGKIIEVRKPVSSMESFDFTSRPAGIYMLSITVNGQASVWKIIRE